MSEIRLRPGELEQIKTHYKLDDDGRVHFGSGFSRDRCAIAVPALVGEIEHLSPHVGCPNTDNDDLDCPWCRIAELEGERDVLTGQVAGRDEQIEQFKRGGQELGKILTVLTDLIKDAYQLGATDPIGALHILGNYLAEVLEGEGGLPADEHNRIYRALKGQERERDALREQVAGRDATIQRVRELSRQMRDWTSPYGMAIQYANRIDEALDGDPAGEKKS